MRMLACHNILVELNIYVVFVGAFFFPLSSSSINAKTLAT